MTGTQWVFIHVHCAQMKMRRQTTTSLPVGLSHTGAAALWLVVEAQGISSEASMGSWWIPSPVQLGPLAPPVCPYPKLQSAHPGAPHVDLGPIRNSLSKRPFSRPACGTDRGPRTSLLTDGCS